MNTIQHPQLKHWKPPEDYQSENSSIDGITVFAPKPKTSKSGEQKTYKCPQCGATTKYDVSKSGVACEHCGHIEQAPSKTVGRSAKEFEFTLDTMEKAQHGWGKDLKEMSCNSCGAGITISEGALTATCPFCASNNVNIRKAPSDNLRPRFLIPFNINPEDTGNITREWLGKGWYHPDDLKVDTILDRFVGIYLSFWTFDADIQSRWKAEVGYEKQERYYDHHNHEWKTRTKIDWRWENGHVDVGVDDLLVIGNTHISRHILEQISSYDLDTLAVYNPDYLAGWQALTYDITLPDAWEQGKATMRETAKGSCYADINSSHIRNFSMLADFHNESWRYLLLPVYIATYRYEGVAHQVMINGQNGAVAGQKPVAWWKIWLAIAAILSPGFLLVLIGIPLLFFGGIGMIPIILGAILFLIGGIISFTLYKKAVDSETS